MAKTKTANKSKPAKKTVKKTFHRQPAVAEQTAPVVPEPTPPEDQTETPQQVETGTQPQPEPEAEPKPEPGPIDPEPQTTTEDITPIASTINPPQDDEESSTIAEDSTTTTDAENTTSDKNDSESESAPEEPQNQTPPAESLSADPNEGGIKKLLFIALIIVILATVSIALYYLYTKKIKTSDKPQPTPTAQTSESQPQTSSLTLNKADWTLEVLNGSGKTGAAAALAEKLSAKGYQVIKTGNAEEDTAVSQVFFADSTKDQADLFLEDITAELPNASNTGSLTDSTASARIIIGAE